jgi:Holliday junction resolvasome RuvABC endonuclease subunit
VIAKGPAPALTSRLNDLKEEIEIMVPELTARVAAVEHLLVEKGLCTHDDLLRARQFVDV